MILVQSRNDTNLDEWSEPRKWSTDEILKEINRYHSAEWIPYVKSDWLEGWSEWVEGEYHRIYKKEEV